MCGTSSDSLNWTRAGGGDDDDDTSPFWYCDLPSEDVARAIAERAVLVRGIVEEWGSGEDGAACAAACAAYDESRKTPYLSAETTFRVEVEDFGRNGGRAHVRARLDELQIPFEGKVDLTGTPDHVFWSVVCDHARTDLGGTRHWVLFGRLVGRGDRSTIKKYELTKRLYLGPTTMDPEMSLLIANFAQARSGGIVLDPFCGTGSMIVAAAHYGAMTMGLDIDPRVIKHGKSSVKKKKQGKFMETAEDGSCVNVWSNFEQYGLQPPVALVHGDLHALPTRKFGLEGMLQGIVADPPYGVRAGGRKSGGRKPLAEDYVIPEELRENHIPSTAPYPFGEMNDDLLDLAARFLSIGGKLVYFLPGSIADAEREIRDLPAHPLLRLRWHALEPFNTLWGRRLVTYEKIAPYDADIAIKARHDAVTAREASSEPDLIERMRALVWRSREARLAGDRADRATRKHHHRERVRDARRAASERTEL